MKKQNIFMCLIFVITLVFTSNIVVNAETLPSLSDMVNNIEPYNFDGNDYPNIRGKDVNLTVYAYLNPKYGHGSADNPSLPAPFNKHYTYSSTGTKTFYVGAVSSPAGGYDAYLFYCVGYGMPVDTGETLVSSNNVYGWNESVIDEHSKNLISLALIYGFDSDSSHGSSVSSSCLAVRNTPDGRHVYANAPKVFATQVACWVASTNLINSQYEDLIARYLIEIDGQLEEETYYIYSDIIGKVKKAMKMPTYASTDPNNTPVYELQYNSEKKRFEYTMTDDNELGLNGDKITITQKLEGTGLNCEVDGNRVTIYTNTVVGTKNNPVKVSIQKDINNGRGVAGFWQKQGLSSGKIGQPLTRLVDDSRTPEFGYYSVYTPGYKIRIHKTLQSTSGNKGNASPRGAVYGIYKDERCSEEVARLTIDENGYSNKTDYLEYRTYYLKETTFPEGINPDAVVPGESVTFREKIYTASYDNRNQGTDTVTVSIKRIINIPNLGRIHVIKYNNNFNSTDEVPAAGAILALTLKSNKDCVYYATINEKGYAQFINKDLENLGYEYTIPYGIYEISEIQESNPKEHTHFYLQPETVEIKRDTQVEYRIHSDEPVPAWLKIVKEDKDSKQVVKLEGAKYKIWDVNNNDWVSMMLYPSGEYINEFETNDEGYLYTPQAVQPGTYVIYETQAPEGYYLDDEWRLPEKEEDLGNDKVSGKKVVINKLTTGILDDTSYPEGGIVTGSLVVNTDIKNTPLKVDLELYKKAEKITGVTTSEVNYEIDNEVVISEEKYRPTYSLVGLEGVGYRIYAVEDTYTPDGILRYTKGQMIADITTNEEGYAVARDIYPGEYSIIEYKTPIGYIKDENIPNVILENKNQYVKNATVKKELTDIRQKLGLKFKKNFEEVKYTIGEKVEQKAVFGIYTSEPILNYKGNAVIPKNALVDLVEINGSTDVISNRDLPKGKYYVIELYTSAPYTINSKKTEFELEYNDDSEQEYVVVEGEEYNNKPIDGNFVIVKLSSDIHSEGFIVMNGTEIINDELDKIQKKVIEDIGKLNNDDEIINYLNENKMHFLPGAKFRIYADKECSEGKEVRVRDEVTGEFKILEIVTNKVGLIRVNNIPIGEYYIKEIEAPDGCQLPEEEEKRITKIVVENNLTNENKVYQTIVNDSIVGGMIYKEDIFTSEAIPDCIYEIRDENGNVLLHSKTTLDGDGNAVAYIPLSMFENNKKYTFVEIKAPDIYEIDTTPHEFEAKFDENGKWITEPIKVTNKRKTRQVIVRKLDAETSEPLQGCVFTIALIDPKTGEQKVDAKTGEPIYLVENAITNENGEYVIDKAPMGTYKFIEIKAPEGYELDEDLTGYEFTIDNNSPETIIFEVTNTGDIQVIVLSIVSIISLIGIAIIMKNKIICKN